MRQLALGLILSFGLCLVCYSQQNATTQDGTKVILLPNGTWVNQGEESSIPIQIIVSGLGVPNKRLDGSHDVDAFWKAKNNTNNTIKTVKFAISLFDANGKLIFMRTSFGDHLSPGIVRTFEERAYGINGIPAKVEISFDSMSED